jgi:hypothetical protein
MKTVSKSHTSTVNLSGIPYWIATPANAVLARIDDASYYSTFCRSAP